MAGGHATRFFVEPEPKKRKKSNKNKAKTKNSKRKNGEINFEYPEIFEPVFTTNKRHYVLKGGRGSGKSWFAALFVIINMLQRHCFVMVCREFQDTIKESSKLTLENMIKRLGVQDRFVVSKLEINCIDTGARCIFKGLAKNYDSLRSLEGIDIVVIDEAHRISRASMRALLPTIRSDDAVLLYVLNPHTPQDVIFDDYVTNADDTVCVIHADLDDNPWKPKFLLEQRARQKKTLDPAEWAHIWKGDVWLKSSDCVIPRDIWEIGERKRKGHVGYGIDIGFSTHPTVGVAVRRTANAELYVEREVTQPGALDLSDLEEFLAKMGCQEGDTIYTDTQMLQWRKAGPYNLMHVAKGRKMYDITLARLRQTKTVINPACEGTIHNYLNFRYKRNAMTDEVTHEIDRNSPQDYCDAVRYATHGLWRDERRGRGKKTEESDFVV